MAELRLQVRFLLSEAAEVLIVLALQAFEHLVEAFCDVLGLAGYEVDKFVGALKLGTKAGQ